MIAPCNESLLLSVVPLGKPFASCAAVLWIQRGEAAIINRKVQLSNLVIFPVDQLHVRRLLRIFPRPFGSSDIKVCTPGFLRRQPVAVLKLKVFDWAGCTAFPGVNEPVIWLHFIYSFIELFRSGYIYTIPLRKSVACSISAFPGSPQVAGRLSKTLRRVTLTTDSSKVLSSTW